MKNADDPEMARPETKVWLRNLKIAHNDGYSMRELTAILDVVDRHREQFLEAWRDHFDD